MIMALAYTVRDRLLQRWLSTIYTYLDQHLKVVSYLSAEFLLASHLGNKLINLGFIPDNNVTNSQPIYGAADLFDCWGLIGVAIAIAFLCRCLLSRLSSLIFMVPYSSAWAIALIFLGASANDPRPS
jgi:hypothetical protein